MRAAREQAALIGCLYGNRTDLRDQILALDGGTAVVFASQFNPNGFPPSWWMIRQGNVMFIVNAGTTNSTQWARHLSGILGEVQPSYPNSIVHPGFYDAGVTLNFSAMQVFLGPFIEDFVYSISGHSFGGGTGHLIARAVVNRVGSHRVQLMTFGEPRVFATVNPVPDAPSVHWRFDKEADIVTSLPPVCKRYSLLTLVLRKFSQWPPPKLTGKLGGPQDTVSPTEPGLPAPWQHFGRQAWVWSNGQLQLEGESRPPRPSGAIPPDAANLEKNHVIPTGYWPVLKANLQRNPNPGEEGLIAIGDTMVAEYGSQTFPDLPIQQDVNLQALRNLLLRDPSAPITQEEGARSQGTSLTPTAIRLAGESNGEFFGSSIMAEFWDVTMAINNDTYGKSQTVTLGSNVSLAQAYAQSEQLVKKRASLLGRAEDETTKQYAAPNGLGSPAVELLKIVDPRTPRFGQVFDVPFSWGEPHAAAGSAETSNAADPLWNSISINLYGLNGAVRQRYTLTIVGFPDRMIEAGAIKWNYLFGAGITEPAQTLATKMKAFLDELTASEFEFFEAVIDHMGKGG